MPDVDERARLNEALERAHARIVTLERELEQENQHLARLRAEMAALDEMLVSAPSVDETANIRAPAEKLTIFRSLFRGRPDVYPTRFVSREGKQGYGPACANKFVRGTCELPRVKCGECKNQAFLPADDAAYLAHLRSDHVMGVYPMLQDGTCWFLAVDFDKATWKEDVRAFIATCRRLEPPFAVERSRSGNGAHVWFFFSAPVAVWVARRLGCYVLTETMAVRHELSMESYDRLFPSQDHMPKGGFGNLIALPLQKEARAHANTELLDDELVRFPGERQWDVLATIQRIAPATVERLVAYASRNDRVLGVRASDDSEDDKPWLVEPSSKRPRSRVEDEHDRRQDHRRLQALGGRATATVGHSIRALPCTNTMSAASEIRPGHCRGSVAAVSRQLEARYRQASTSAKAH